MKMVGIENARAVTGGYGGSPTFLVLHKDGTLSSTETVGNPPRTMFRRLRGITDVVAVSAATRHFAALKSDGTVWTWGHNDAGQLGSDSTTERNAPLRATGIRDAVNIAAGNDATLVVKKDGTVWGWGKDIYALTPKGLEVRSSSSPLQIPGLKDIVAVAIPGQGYVNGTHFLAVDRSGKVWSWGFNPRGQLGHGTKGNESVKKPAMVVGLDGVTAVAAGGMHSLALRSDGTICSWGKNSSGQLGNASGDDSAFPVSVVSGRVGLEKKP
ncbi:MAG: hypothetical protein WA140_00970 [Geobacteraceae bacterium]